MAGGKIALVDEEQDVQDFVRGSRRIAREPQRRATVGSGEGVG
jgi:hypothetical protein